MPKDLITLQDYTEAEIIALLDLAETLADAWHAGRMPQHLAGKSIALIGDAEGFRNRVSFELGIAVKGVLRYVEALRRFAPAVNRARCCNHLGRLPAIHRARAAPTSI
ncbi:MAG: hypothetical protein JXC32_04730 [Anaerolineae bacterium]|nr:hypothetical protein [Anaerolineae bacterium]